jgi:hypothetical protein
MSRFPSAFSVPRPVFRPHRNFFQQYLNSSDTAGLTPNQQFGYPLLEQNGGVVVGDNGGEFYPANRIIQPTAVDIIRPDDLPTP